MNRVDWSRFFEGARDEIRGTIVIAITLWVLASIAVGSVVIASRIAGMF